MKCITTSLSTPGIAAIIVVPASIATAMFAAAVTTGHTVLFPLLGFILYLFPVVAAYGIDVDIITTMDKVGYYCPYCGAGCKYTDTNRLPFAKSKIVYECMTECITRRKKYVLHKSITCGITSDECDTI